MPRLDFYVGYQLQTSVKLGESQVTLGRDPECVVAMPDPHVSRLHAVVEPSPGGYRIENRGANGTRVNGRQVEDPQELAPGDAIFIGSYILVYQQDDAPVEQLASTILAD